MQLYLAWVAYFYLTMALRECVLLVNGSQIRPWWVQHHYWSAACSLVMLALPVSSPSEWRADAFFEGHHSWLAACCPWNGSYCLPAARLSTLGLLGRGLHPPKHSATPACAC
jgi:hypothetical protein